MVLSSWQSHCESWPGSFDECRTAMNYARVYTHHRHLLAALLAQLIGWMSVVKLFQIATPPTVFVRFLRNLAHMIYVPKLWNRFSHFWVKNIWRICKILRQQRSSLRVGRFIVVINRNCETMSESVFAHYWVWVCCPMSVYYGPNDTALSVLQNFG